MIALVAMTGSALAQPARDEPAPPAPAAEPARDEPAPPPAAPSRAEPAPPPAPTRAEPAPTPAIEPAGAAASAGAMYPMALVRRPVVLPRHAIEGGALIRVTTIDAGNTLAVYTFVPRLVWGFGRGELEAGAAIYLGDSFPETSADTGLLSSGRVAARLLASPGIAAGAELEYLRGGSLRPRASIATKRHTSDASAIELSLAAGLDHLAPERDSLVATAQVRAQAQLAPRLAFEGRAALHARASLDDAMASGLAQDYGLRAVLAASADVDLVAGVDWIASNGTAMVWTLGVAARRVP